MYLFTAEHKFLVFINRLSHLFIAGRFFLVLTLKTLITVQTIELKSNMLMLALTLTPMQNSLIGLTIEMLFNFNIIHKSKQHSEFCITSLDFFNKLIFSSSFCFRF